MALSICLPRSELSQRHLRPQNGALAKRSPHIQGHVFVAIRLEGTMRSKIRVVLMAAVAGGLLLGSMLLTRPTAATSEQKPPRFGMIKRQIGLVPKEVATSAYLGNMDASEQVKMLI